MIVNKSMFPLQTGFGVISKMQDKFATLQMQLGTGMKAQTLADMGRDLPVSLSVRSRLSTIAGYNSNIDQVSLRLSFYDNALSRMDKIEGEARSSAVQGQYGTNNINMANISALSRARLDEMVTMLNSDVAGRYLFGGNVTDKAPLPDTDTLLYGSGGRAGYQTILTERRAADAGDDDYGRLDIDIPAATPNRVVLAEDGAHPFGYKISTVNGPGVTPAVPGVTPASMSVDFSAPPNQIAAGQAITIGLTLPDGTETQITLTAAETATGAAGEFVIGADEEATALAFKTALQENLVRKTESELAAASSFAASQNFFNGAGEPVLRVDTGTPYDPYNAQSLKVADAKDTVLWYSGQSPAVSAANMGRLSGEALDATVSLTENVPVSKDHGFKLTNAVVSATPAGGADLTYTSGDPSSMDVVFDGTELAGKTITLTLTEPGGKVREVTLTAVSGKAGAGQFKLGDTPEDTAANFNAAMQRAITLAAADAEGNPRQSVNALVEDFGRVNYGMQANESGYLHMVRTFAAMSLETYPEVTLATDPNSADLNPARLRFDAMARRQQSALSEARNIERGSIELVAMEIGVAWSSLKAAGERHTNYKAQLDNLLSDVETVSKEDVAMEILALQTRLSASYQVTAMTSKLSLVNFL